MEHKEAGWQAGVWSKQDIIMDPAYSRPRGMIIKLLL
jgi:hypothetical protein